MAIGAAAIEATYGTQYPFGPGSEVLCEFFFHELYERHSRSHR